MKRSKHNLSHYRLTTFNQGELVPVACEEVLPGDSWRWRSSALMRVTPLAAPVMHPVHVSIHHWFVPARLLWTGWEDFITGKNIATDLPSLSIASGDTACKRLAQELGCGLDTSTVSVNALPFRAYNQIVNEFYRDQDLVTPWTEATGNTDSVANYAVRMVSWEKDYFTTARPAPQQGATATMTFSSGQAPVDGIGFTDTPLSSMVGKTFRKTSPLANEAQTGSGATANWVQLNQATIAFKRDGSDSATVKPVIYADLTQAGASISINDWRAAMALQRMREHRNRFGSRYTDYLAFLGVRSSDARLQRPEYLGGGKNTVAFSEVLSTATVPSGSSTGDLSGHGIAAVRTRPYTRFFEEHGYVLSLMFVRPKTVYQNRVPRWALRRKVDHFWQKEMEMMGDQAVTNREVYSNAANDTDVFGYVPRYDEYRHAQSYVSGEFRTSTYQDWHMARVFASQPALNAAFVTADPTDRIYQTTTVNELQVMISHQVAARRLVSFQSRN